MDFKFCLIVTLVYLCSIASATPLQPRLKTAFIKPKIVGGTVAIDGQLPYQVSLSISSTGGVYQCGGTIVTTFFVVTAAHCVTDYTLSANGPVFMSGLSVTVTAGQIDKTTFPSTMQTKTATNILVHANYSSESMLNDVALLYFATPFVFNSAVGALPLPAQGTVFPGGTACTVSGWGTTSEGGSVSDVLLYATVNIVDFDACNNSALGAYSVDRTMLCTSTNFSDSCQGDSGGPVACASGDATYLAGVVSWGIGCAQGVPAANTYVSDFADLLAYTMTTVIANGGSYSDFKFISTKLANSQTTAASAQSALSSTAVARASAGSSACASLFAIAAGAVISTVLSRVRVGF